MTGGLELKRMEFVLNEQTADDSTYQQLEQQQNSQQEHYTRGSTDESAGGHEAASFDVDQSVAWAQDGTHVSDESINVWI